MIVTGLADPFALVDLRDVASLKSSGGVPFATMSCEGQCGGRRELSHLT